MLETPAERHCQSRAEFLRDCRILEESGLLDAEAYRVAARLDPAANAAQHYLLGGWRSGLEPNPNFEGSFLYSYFRSIGLYGPPAITYLILRAAGWAVYATRAQTENVAATIRASGLFDERVYAARLSNDDLNPLMHYIIVGERIGFAPSDGFHPDYYGARYPDVSSAGLNYLVHYLSHGRLEGRRPTSVALQIAFDSSRIDPTRETVLLLSHQASRTGAPILAYNIAMRLGRKYNVVALLLTGGELISAFKSCCAATIGPLTLADCNEVEAEYIVKRLIDSYSISYAIANSIESRVFIPPLARALIPVVTLVHEFASYTLPKGSMGKALEWSTKIVFSTEVTASSAISEHPTLANRQISLLPQGRCDVPGSGEEQVSKHAEDLRQLVRPNGVEDALVVLGCGTIHWRKGVDLFISCAAAIAALKPKRQIRFVWIGSAYEVDYVRKLSKQIKRSGLTGKVELIDEVSDLDPAYATSDVFLLSSRLDPLPNVAIEAAFHGLPIVCFDEASGIANLLNSDPALRECVVPYLDAAAAARVIAKFANDDCVRIHTGVAIRRLAEMTFKMDQYVDRLDELGREAMVEMRQRIQDFTTIKEDTLFDQHTFLPPDSTLSTRDDGIRSFLAGWGAVGTSRQSAKNSYFRRPVPGFHPQIYAHENSSQYNTTLINPLAHFIRSGKPDGPWRHDVITPLDHRKEGSRLIELRTALHVHFHYPELAPEFFDKIAINSSSCDLLLSTNTACKAKMLRQEVSAYRNGEVKVRVVPNRGRDIGPFLTGFEDDIVKSYDVVGHIHSKRSLFTDAILGETWREFLWQNLLGDLYPMIDIILEHFQSDKGLGLVFADDPHLPDWDENMTAAQDIADRMGMKEPLPPFFDFPVGTMFWARTKALESMFNLGLEWDDYPEEPVPIDGTILHVLERLVPFAVRHAGYRFATTSIPGMSW